ncbi:Transducin family protein / WD-40 repeat family protein [Prunus dulcis]|uniref:Transducin family protein / WD-40 repeat family protein n=1 Tax=Prunus dulcis TaxID=3755 RepID=A0A4Y1R250_PRUDU|nr:Transducin family protein / WD-40 repeat family protein [Prunus dulcis]
MRRETSSSKMWELQSDWYSPTRLNSNPITQYDFPGDRFIPNRSLMDLDQARSLLSNRTTPNRNSNFNEVYRKSIEDKLTLDSEGNPFRMLVFRGSPKSNRKSIRCVDLMRQDEAKELDGNGKHHEPRRLPKGEARILDAPNIRNDFYMSTMDWGKNNVIAIALGKDLFLWNAENREVHKLLQVDDLNDFPSSVAWSQDAKTVAVGFRRSKLQLWDAETSKLVRSLENHKDRIASITWNGHTLTSGSRDKSIINHDEASLTVRAGSNVTCRLRTHTEEVCGLKWSGEGNVLASGGNENLLYIWDSSKMNSQRFLFRLKDHRAAVKALAWCPYQSEVLASGAGTKDGCIKIWNTKREPASKALLPKLRQVCGLEWNRHHKEIMSGHGYSASELIKNQLCLWRYPSMEKVGSLNRYTSRVLHLSQSPDGLTVVSAVADGSLRFLEVFGPPSIDKSRISLWMVYCLLRFLP